MGKAKIGELEVDVTLERRPDGKDGTYTVSGPGAKALHQNLNQFF